MRPVPSSIVRRHHRRHATILPENCPFRAARIAGPLRAPFPASGESPAPEELLSVRERLPPQSLGNLVCPLQVRRPPSPADRLPNQPEALFRRGPRVTVG